MYGKQIGNVSYTRSYTGVASAGLAGEIKKSATEPREVTVTVQATLGVEGRYFLVVEADGQRATVNDVEEDDLADDIARLIAAIAKAARNGDLVKNRQADSSPFGIGVPRSNRDALMFG